MKLEDLIKPKERDGSDIITDNLNKQITDEISDHLESRENILSDIMIHDEVSKLYDTNTIYPDYLVIDPEVVGYPNDDFQEIIYNWVGSKIPYGNVSVKDLGCGRGDFGNWLNNNRPDAEYVGIDYNPTIINVGKQKYKDSLKLIINEYSKEDIRTDYTVCIGTLNEDNGLDKWENFNKTLIYALNNTKHSIFFVLARNFDLYDGYCDFPFTELFNHLDKNIMFEIDYSKLEDIYLLTINIGSFNT